MPMVVDHINDDGLDNRKANLRTCTNQENLRNRRKNRKGSSRYRGVHWAKKENRWCGRVAINGKRIYCGFFSSEDDAAKAVDATAIELYGRFARLNFPSVVTPELRGNLGKPN